MSGGQIANHVRIKTKAPEVGDGVTIFHYTDRSAGTVVRVSKSGKSAWVIPCKAIRTDDNGMSESQTYRYEDITTAEPFRVTLRKDGQWRRTKHENKVAFGFRNAYHDFSF